MAVALAPYGVSAEVDAYHFMLNLVTLPRHVWFSVLAIIPHSVGSADQQDPPMDLDPLSVPSFLGLTVDRRRWCSGLLTGSHCRGLVSSHWLGLPAPRRA